MKSGRVAIEMTALRRQAAGAAKAVKVVTAERDALRAEVERLRGALRDCMRQSILPCPCVRIAHEALAGKERKA